MKTFLKKLFQKLKTFTKEIGGNIKQGFFIGISFLGTVLVIGGVYAYTWIAPANVNTGDTLTSTAWNDIIGDLNYLKDKVDNIYPIGSIYTSVSSTNPSTLFGGTWSAFGAGRVLVGFNSSDTSFDAVEETGGSKDAIVVSHQHNGTTDSAGNHSHTYRDWYTSGGNGHGDEAPISSNSYENPETTSTAGAHTHTFSTSWVGSSGTNANLQPYIVVYMWKRTG